ncbi:MAG: hypothetical protein ABIH82_05425 [Candidatus Woesearchaeota archaeon]
MVFTVLSAVARLGGGVVEPVCEETQNWVENGRNYSRRRERDFAENYLTEMLRCGQPESVDDVRWFQKALSNDQTAFSGFTSLVDVVQDNNIGYGGRIKLLPRAAFIEPFVLRNLSESNKNKLEEIRANIASLDSTQVNEINQLLNQAEQIAPVPAGRKKGKSPIFFYSVTDQPFQLPASFYTRMEKATSLVAEGMVEVASRFNNCLDDAIFGKGQKERQFFTGSIDFMVVGNDIYLIDIGSPAVGYLADIKFASEALGRTPNFGLDELANATAGEIIVYSGKSDDLGFFSLEHDVLVNGLRERGVNVQNVIGNSFEVNIKGVNYPSQNYDFLTRNQPLRNKILQAMSSSLGSLGVRVPTGISVAPESEELLRFYEQTRQGDFGLLVKKKTFFSEYEQDGGAYFKPLVTPLWSGEIRANRRRTTLFEQFIPSLIQTDVAGDLVGERSYEVRLYFCAGGEK